MCAHSTAPQAHHFPPYSSPLPLFILTFFKNHTGLKLKWMQNYIKNSQHVITQTLAIEL